MLEHLADALAVAGVALVGFGLALALGVGWGLFGAGILVIAAAVVTAGATG
jgi:hypothetical protein